MSHVGAHCRLPVVYRTGWIMAAIGLLLAGLMMSGSRGADMQLWTGTAVSSTVVARPALLWMKDTGRYITTGPSQLWHSQDSSRPVSQSNNHLPGWTSASWHSSPLVLCAAAACSLGAAFLFSQRRSPHFTYSSQRQLKAGPFYVRSNHQLYSSTDDSPRLSPFNADVQLPPHDDNASHSSLTAENVQRVLDEVRPYLIADGGNVDLVEIVGTTVRLQLQGACGSCPSSTTTMSLGIKRRLQEEIPSITDVEEVSAPKAGLPLTPENVEQVLADIRPFLTGAGGGDVQFQSIDAGIVRVRLTGPAKDIMTIRVALTQKLRENIPDILAVQLI